MPNFGLAGNIYHKIKQGGRCCRPERSTWKNMKVRKERMSSYVDRGNNLIAGGKTQETMRLVISMPHIIDGAFTMIMGRLLIEHKEVRKRC